MLARDRRVDLILELLALALTSIVIVPFAIMVLGSFKNPVEAARFDLALPGSWQAGNYAEVLRRGKVASGFVNSTVLTAASVALTMAASAMAGVYLGRRRTRGSERIQALFAVGLIAPMSIIPTVRLLQAMHLSGTHTGVVLVFVALHLPFSVFLISRFVKTVPRDMDEAALMDGCRGLELFLHVSLPLLLPVVYTASTVVFMSVWNNFILPLYLLNTTAKWPLPLTVYAFFGRYSRDWNLVFAHLTVTSLPVVLFYALAQRHVVSGVTAGALKG
jgi:raffinose/stachyose/melibiose transport system permease protein